MIAIEKIREALDGLPTLIIGGPGSPGPTEYVARQAMLSRLDELEGVAIPMIKAEINRSCTSEQAKAIRELFERGPQGWVEGVDFIDHTRGGTLCYTREEMEAFREALKKGSTVESAGGRPAVPEHVDLAKLYEAQKIIRDAPQYFCDQCGATNPKHGFYPLHHSHVVYDGGLVGSVSSVTCNCCHATEKNPCPYCEEEK